MRVLPTDSEFFRLEKVPSDVVSWLRMSVRPVYRFFDTDKSAWFVHKSYISGAVQLASDKVQVDVSKLPHDQQSQLKSVMSGGRVLSESEQEAKLRRYYADLHLLPSAPVAIVDAVWRTLAKTSHPDKGGDAEKFKVYSKAYKKIKEG